MYFNIVNNDYREF